MDTMLDPKHQLLFALCDEYKKPIPDFSSVTAQNLGMDIDVFSWALRKLQNEGLINGLKEVPTWLFPLHDIPWSILPSRDGLLYAEKLIMEVIDFG